MKRCKSCGSELPEHARFCGSCGYPLDAVAASAVTDISTLGTGPLPAPSPQDRRSSNSPIGGGYEQKEGHSNVLMDFVVPLIPSGAEQALQGSVPIVQGTPLAGSAPMVQGTLATSRPFATAQPPHMPSQTAQSLYSQPQTPLQNRPPSSTSHLLPQQAETSSSQLHHSHTETHTHTHLRKHTGAHTHTHTHTNTHTHTHTHEESQPKQQHHQPHERHQDKRQSGASLSNMVFLVDSTGNGSSAGGVSTLSLAFFPVSARGLLGEEFLSKVWVVPKFFFSLWSRGAGSVTKKSQGERGVPSVGGTLPMGGVAMVQETSSSQLHHSPTETHTHIHLGRHTGTHSHIHTHTYTHSHTHTHEESQSNARRKGAIALIVLSLLVLILLGGSLVLAKTFFGKPVPPAINPASSAIVTITPASADLKHTYTISVVTGTPDASKNQVGGARILSSTTQPYTQTVNATGQGTIPGTQAKGTLSFRNPYSGSPRGVPVTYDAGTVLDDDTNRTPNVQMMIDATITVPGDGTTVTVPAHVVQIGTIGNISQIRGWTHYSGGYSDPGPPTDIYNSTPFTGGTDPQTYTIVKQSDIDGAANALEQAHTPNAQQELQGQVQANEQFIGTPTCTPNTPTPDHMAGDQATSVTVTVTFTCMGEVYSQDKALSLAAQLLTNHATTDPGPGYALTGKIARTVTNATLSDAGQGTVTLTINAEGVWVYQFSATQKQALAKLMAKKKKQAVQTLLLKQQGVVMVAIHLVGGDGTLFPTDPRQIKIVIKDV